MKHKKRALFNSVVSLLLCLSMFVGTTFAWFTDEVVSGGNIIASGNLDATMEYATDPNGEWKNAADGAIFSYEYWEPGYTDMKFIRIGNAGNLAFRYQLHIVPNAATPAGEANLADVIDVYYGEVTDGFTVPTDFPAEGMTRVGTLAELIGDTDGAAHGVLLPTSGSQNVKLNDADKLIAKTGSTTACIMLNMREDAGNEYQNLTVGGSFRVQLLATQYTYENDSFGNDYDADATLPEITFKGGKATAAVTAENGVVASDVKMDGGEVQAVVPAGVTLVEGTENLTLNVSVLEESTSGVTAAENESILSVDVHVDGVDENNTTPILVTLHNFMQPGLNSGNYTLYHVEDDGTKAMTAVTGTPVNHNEYTYDPANGTVVVAMASFSEVTQVSDLNNAWNGKRDYSWYDSDKTTLLIANADQLAGFGAIVGGMDSQTPDSFSGQTVKLISNINIGDTDSENGIVFYPIGYYNSEGTYEKSGKEITSYFNPFEGTFDGNGHSISNFYQNTWEMKGDHNWYPANEQRYRDGMGLFGKVYGGTVKNLTVKNFSSDGEIATTGTIAAYADCGATFENIAIFNCNPRVYNIGNGGIVGCVGWYANDTHTEPVTFRNITVDNTNKISALWGSWDVACGGLVGQYYPASGQENAIDNGGIYMENCHVAAQIDVNNDVCANYQYYAYRYAGILIGSVRENETIDGHVYPKMDGITASNCTVHFGDWNDYYYCELVANSLASYTHDHQMSRLTQVASVDVANMEVTDLKGNTTDISTSGRYNYVVVNGSHATENAKCYHFVDGAVWNHEQGGYETTDVDGDGKIDDTLLKEDKQHLYLEFNNLVTGYGWGVTSKGVGEMDGVKILDRTEANSVTKFESVASNRYQSGATVSVGELFKYIESCGVELDTDNVQVTASPANKRSHATAVYTANESDWTQGTLAFTGFGDLDITITDYHFCNATTITICVYDTFRSITITPVDNYYNIGHSFGPADFVVMAIGSNGLGTVLNDYTLDTTGVNANVEGTYTVSASFTNETDGQNQTFTASCDVKIKNLTLLDKNDHAFGFLYREYNLNNEKDKVTIGADTKEYTSAINGAKLSSGETLNGYSENRIDLIVTDARRSTKLGFNAPVGIADLPVRGFGYYLDEHPGSLVTTTFSYPENTWSAPYSYYAHVDTLTHGMPLDCRNFKAGETHTVHWVVLLDDGLLDIGTWTINMKEATTNDDAFIDTEKENVNVIILAGQSNAFGITPLTNEVKDKYASVDFPNVFLHYKNVFYADGSGASPDIMTYYNNADFEQYSIGMGVYDDATNDGKYFGPELAIAAELANTHSNEKWYIIKYTMPSSVLATNWLGSGFTVDGQNTNMMEDMLDFIAKSVDELDDAYDVQIKGFAWMQGESDASEVTWANAYAVNEQELVSAIRTKFAAYATRTTNALDVPGSGIAFMNAGIASYDYVDGQIVDSQWTYENIVNTAKVSNSEYIFSAFKAADSTDLLAGVHGGTFGFKQASHLEAYEFGGQLWIKKPNGDIANSMFIDTVGFHTKALIDKYHDDPAYTADDKVDHAHYAPDYMTYLGAWFVNCMELLHSQNG